MAHIVPLSTPLLCRLTEYLAESDQDVLAATDGRIRPFLQQQRQLAMEQGKETRSKDENETTENSEKNGPQANITTRRLRIVDDANTLLARLNTRILHRRLMHTRTRQQQQQHDEYHKGETTETDNPHHQQQPYAINKTTQELARDEWNSLLQTFNHNTAPPIPNPHELLLFSPCPRPVAVLASYPRSGNSLLRNLFERITLRVTGSDMRGGLEAHDLVGEAAISSRQVQFVKTHWPERRGHAVYLGGRVVLLVRNPYDALESYFQLMMTDSHTTSLTQEQRFSLAMQQHFATMVQKEIQVWRDFHQYWLNLRGKIPILLVRYEDLIRYPDSVMERVIQFVLEIQDMTFFRQRIQQCILTDKHENNNNGQGFIRGAYRPRSGGIGKSLVRYSPALRDTVNSVAYNLLHQLGYGKIINNNDIESWKLEPIPKFALEMKVKRKEGNSPDKPKPKTPSNAVKLNAGVVARTGELRTDWKRLRQELRDK